MAIRGFQKLAHSQSYSAHNIFRVYLAAFAFLLRFIGLLTLWLAALYKPPDE